MICWNSEAGHHILLLYTVYSIDMVRQHGTVEHSQKRSDGERRAGLAGQNPFLLCFNPKQQMDFVNLADDNFSR